MHPREGDEKLSEGSKAIGSGGATVRSSARKPEGAQDRPRPAMSAGRCARFTTIRCANTFQRDFLDLLGKLS